MPTDDERREVARKLKHLADGHVAVECSAVAKALNLDYEVYGSVAAFSADAVSYVADLIDPTCHKVIPNETSGECFCSECGALLGEYGYTAYCPGCGARVVRSHGE